MSGLPVNFPLPLVLCWLVFNGFQHGRPHWNVPHLPQVMGMMCELCLISWDFPYVMAYSPVVLCMYPGSLKDEPVRLLLNHSPTTPLADHVGTPVCTPGLDHRSSLAGGSRLLLLPCRNHSRASCTYFGLSASLKVSIVTKCQGATAMQHDHGHTQMSPARNHTLSPS